MRKAVFLDRDGVLVVPEFRDGRGYAPRSLEDFRIYPEARGALSLLRDAGYFLVVVTNQPDIGNGKVASAVVDEMHARLRAQLPIDEIEVCPHSQGDGCTCRKPSPGMIVHASQVHGIDLSSSFVVGDRASDVEAGAAAGCSTVFIDLNYTEERQPERVDYIARSVADAASIILNLCRMGKHDDAC